MPNEHDGNEPSPESNKQPLSQSPATPTAPQQRAMDNLRNYDPNHESNASNELAREFGIVEKFQIGTNLLLAAVGIVALVIYNGQLREMRKATRATQLAAEAAKESADIADKTLKEIRAGGTDTHDLAVAAKQQAKATEATAKATNRSIDVTIESDRPWIASNGVTIKGDTLDSIKITANYLNAGKSPARVIEAVFSNNVYETFPKHPPYPARPTHPSRMLVYPGRQITSVAIDPTLTPENIRDVESGSKNLYFYGFVKYEDVRTHKTHVTKFCWFYFNKDNVSVCPEYNDAE